LAKTRQSPRLRYAVIPIEGHAAARQTCLLRALANKQIPGTGIPFTSFPVADLAIVQ
jgi:hypothetical protein